MAVETLPASRSIMLRLVLDCDLHAVRPMTLAAVEFLQEQEATTEELQAVELTLAEACNNAIK
jgi:hypothetical protein